MKSSKTTLIEQVRRKQIVETVIETIASRGFSQTTLGDIAKRAGVSTGVITYHFKNKDDLLEQSIKRLFEAPNAHVIARVDAQPTCRDKLRAYVEANIEFMQGHRSHSVALLYSFGSIGSEQERHRIMQRQHAKIRRFLTNILRAGQDAAEFRSFPAETVAQTIFGALEGVMLQWVLDEDALDLAQCAQELIRMAERHVLRG